MTRSALIVVIVLVAACAPERPGLLELPRVALDGVGRENTVEVIIDREEKIFVAGRRAATETALESMLGDATVGTGLWSLDGGRIDVSRLTVLIRADWFGSMYPVKAVLAACAELRIYRIQFAVSRDGTTAEIDVPLRMSHTPWGDRDFGVHLVIRKSSVVYKMGEDEFESIAALRDGLRKLYASQTLEWDEGQAAFVMSASRVPYARFIEVVELLYAANPRIFLGGPRIYTGRPKRGPLRYPWERGNK